MDIEELERKIEQYHHDTVREVKKARQIILGWVFLGLAVVSILFLEYMPINFFFCGFFVLAAVVAFINMMYVE